MIQRFWAKVAVAGPDECWLWRAAVNHKGYGRFRLDGKARQAHRVAFWLANGRWPSNQTMHVCDVPACVNPAHLVEATNRENSWDMVRKGRSPNGRLTTVEIAAIKAELAAGHPQRRIAERFGVSQGTVSNVKNDRVWQALR